MAKILSEYADQVRSEIISVLESKSGYFRELPGGGADLIKRLLKFSTGGKLFRGCLTVFGYGMFKNGTDKAVFKAGAALEILHSALLIHDDIMDRDLLRRGEKSLFAQYGDFGNARDVVDPEHFGLSMGICAGDICFYIGTAVMASLKADERVKSRILSLWSEELQKVGLAQMQDILLSSNANGISESADTVSEETILELYRYKTARYTFSLPLVTGALLAGIEQPETDLLEKLGEVIGIIFQIKDDEIGLFGTEERIGKPVGTDLEEGKQTLYRFYLTQALKEGKGDRNLRREVKDILDLRNADGRSIAVLREAVKMLGVQQKLEEKTNELTEEAERVIHGLSVDEIHKAVLREILHLNLTRSR